MTHPDDTTRPLWLAYSFALVATGAAYVVTHAFWGTFAHTSWGLFFLAIFASGWYGGLGPSVVSMLVGAIAAVSLVAREVHSIPVDAGSAFRVLVYLAVGSAISAITGQYWAARRDRERLFERERESRRQAEAARDDLQRLASIVESAEDAVVARDPDGRVTVWNPAAERLFGYRRDEILGRSISVLMPVGPAGETDEEAIQTAKEAVEHRETVRVRKDGALISVSLSVSPIRDAAGRTAGVATIARDLTNRLSPEQVLRESERRFRAMANAVPVMLWSGTPEMPRDWFNEAWLDFTGRPLDQESGDGWTAGLHPGDSERCRNALSVAFGQRRPFRMEYRLEGADGEYRWLFDSAAPMLGPDGYFLGFIGCAIDITDRKRAEEGLRRSELHFRTIVQTANEGICLVNRKGETIYVNERMGEILGIPAEQLLRRPVMDFVPPEYHETARTRVRANFAGLSEEFEFPVLRADGTAVPMLIGSSPLRDADGNIVGALGMFSDLTERSRAERSLRESEERYRTLTEAVHQLMWITDPVGETTYVNREWQEYVGRGPVSEGPVDWGDLLFPGDVPRLSAMRHAAIAAGEPYESEYRIRRRDGQYRWFLARVVPMKDEGGRILSWFGSAADIHDLKTAEAELRRAKEEAEAANRAKDNFLAALSHELRTPLTPVLAVSSRLERNPSIPEAARAGFELVRRNVELEARLIDDLLDVTRISKGRIELAREPVDVHEVLRDVLDICAPDALARELRVNARLNARTAWVDGDPARLRQIFWNLLKNAIKFTPKSGRIDVETSDGEGQPGLCVRVTDTGIGIEPGHLSRILHPFQQPAARPGQPGAGLGLGLAITDSLVRAHGGRLLPSSGGTGRGATFTVELATIPPPARPTSERERRAQTAEEPGSRRILLVEDHEETLRVTSDILVEDAYVVRTAGSVEEALAAAGRERFDLVISDIGLPDGSGLELMRRLRDEHGIRGIAITGYGMRDDLERSKAAGFLEHLVKPITAQKLESAVERVLRTAAVEQS